MLRTIFSLLHKIMMHQSSAVITKASFHLRHRIPLELMAHRYPKRASTALLSLLVVPTAAAFSSQSASSRTAAMLTRRTPQDVQLEIKDPVDPTALIQSRAILEELRPASQASCSPEALLSVARRLGDIPAAGSGSDRYVASPSACQAAFDALSDAERRSLLNIHGRVRAFAEAQRRSVVDVEVDIPGGKAGQSVSPCRGE